MTCQKLSKFWRTNTNPCSMSRAGMKRKTTMHCLQALLIRKGTKISSWEDVAVVESLYTKQQIALTRKVARKNGPKGKTEKRRCKRLKGTIKERERLICQKLDGTVVVNLDILDGTDQSPTRMLILLEKISKT